MTKLQTLIDAATLKGYLMADGAPADITAIAQQLVDGLIAGFEVPAQLSNADVRLPELSHDLAKAIITASDKAPSHDESRFVMPETPQAEEIEHSLPEVVERVKDVPVSTGGALDAKPIVKRTRRSKLEADMLPEIQEKLATESFGVVGFGYGVSGQTVKNFLTKYGIDTAQYRKHTGGKAGRSKYFDDVELESSSLPKVAPETTKSEDVAQPLLKLPNGKPDNIWDKWQIAKLQEMKRDGATASAIAVAVGKTATQVNNKWTWLKPKIEVAQPADDEWPEPVKTARPALGSRPVSDRGQVVAELLAAMPEACDRKNSRLKRDDIPRIIKLFERSTMAAVAERLGEAPSTIDSLLKRYGIDYRSLPPAESETQSGSADLAVKPMMKFKTVAITDSWGNANEIQVPEPIAVEKDPDTGATVTKYPAGYAFGAQPQRNVSVKGGS